MRIFGLNRLIIFPIILLAIAISFPYVAVTDAAEWKKPEGYAAEVMDSKGGKIEIYGLHFGRYYNMQKRVSDLFLNQECGTLIVPMKDIQSISNITPVAGKGNFQAAITLTDGRVIKSAFGSLNDAKFESVEGETVLGDYVTALNNVSAIVLSHDKDVPPLKKYEWGETKGKLKAAVACPSGAPIELTSVRVYCGVPFNCIDTNNSGEVMDIVMGESKNTIDLNKINGMSITRQKTEGVSPELAKEEYLVTLATKTGETINATLVDDGYLGGYTSQGWFFYIKIKELRRINFQ